MTIEAMKKIVESGEVAILDQERSSGFYHWWQDNKHRPEYADWIVEIDDIADVFWVRKSFEGLR